MALVVQKAFARWEDDLLEDGTQWLRPCCNFQSLLCCVIVLPAGVAEKLEAVRTCQLHTRPWPVTNLRLSERWPAVGMT